MEERARVTNRLGSNSTRLGRLLVLSTWKSLGLGKSQTLKKCGKKWMKLNH